MKSQNDQYAGLNRSDLDPILKLAGDRIDPALLAFIITHGSNFLDDVDSRSNRPEGGERWQDRIIEEEVPEGVSILDLGCGDGNLLSRLADRKKLRVQGVEIDADQVAACVERGIPVIQLDLDQGLRGFPDDSFDYVILEETLQTLKRPADMLREMRRVGRRGIVTFPNFGYWRVRIDLAVRGRMPRTKWLPHNWYETPNIHLFSIRDFIDHASEVGIAIRDILILEEGTPRRFRDGDNLRAEEAVVIFE
ncbi:MAG: methionine biosynthesis protein MetW [Planctomycetota bacterium]|jgi:methionine biosynthesis protein MetW|nr:methionine biosynthesis protein MetW [Planctomycetota bacterium]